MNLVVSFGIGMFVGTILVTMFRVAQLEREVERLRGDHIADASKKVEG